MAKEYGVKIAISTDAHNPQDLHNIHFGINQARRGWLEKTDVLNTMSLTKLQKFFKK
jgi:DNA polymerase (family 10)